MSISVDKFITGPIETNTYLVYNESKDCLIIDPSSGCVQVLKAIENKLLKPQAIVLTHGHFDHAIGIPEVHKVWSDLPVFIDPVERMLLENAEFNGSVMIGAHYTYQGITSDLVEGNMHIGNFSVQVISVPGHSPGGTAILIEQFLLCGDILFAGSIGRSDFPGGNGTLLIEGIKNKLLVLPEDTVVCPGHGGRSTIGREKRMNPFF